MPGFFEPVVNWIWLHHRALTAGILGLIASGAAAYLLAVVLTRLDRGAREPVGKLIGALALLLIVTVAAATNVAIRAASAATTAATVPMQARPVIEQIALALHPADYAYLTAGVIFLIGAAIWQLHRRRRPEQLSNPDTSRLLIEAGGLLLVTLCIVQRGVEQLRPDTTHAAQLFGTIAGAGVLSMALVQGLRTLLPLRGVFHRVTLERWIDEAVTEPSAPPSDETPRWWSVRLTPPPADAARVKSEQQAHDRHRRILRSITRLARGPVSANRYALLDLPIEQLCGQIAAGADRLLDAPFASTLAMRGSRKQPASVEEVLTAFAAGGEQDIERYLKLASSLTEGAITPEPASPPGDGVQAPEPPAETESTSPGVATPLAPAIPLSDPAQEYVRLRAGLSQRIQRNIDGLQIATTFWWRRVLRGLAFTICGVLGLSVFSGRVTYSVMCAIVGGFVATASRDVIAIVEKARR